MSSLDDSFEKDSEQLEQIREFFFKEFDNLNKNRTRTRSLQGIFHKTEILKAALEEFENIVQKYEQLNETEIWNDLTDKLDIVKKKYENCIQILENTKTKRNTEKNSEIQAGKFHNLRNRRVSVSEDHFPISIEDFSNLNVSISGTDLYFGPIRDPNLLSSTLNNADQSEIDTKSLILNELQEFSVKFEPVYKSFLNKMAYEFPTEKAIKCIPEFRGTAAELDGFLFQADYFAKFIPPRNDQNEIHETETELIHVILSKLKGPAALHFKRIHADTWVEIRDNLQREFKGKLKLEELFQKIETLEQGKTETFQSYKDRVLTMKQHIDEYEANRGGGENSYALRNLRLHFLGGLKNRNLKNLAKAHKEDSLENLITYLQEECIDVEQIEQIEHRLQDAHIAESHRLEKEEQKFNNQRKNFGNFRNRNNFYSNRNIDHDDRNDQRNRNNDRNHFNGQSNNYQQNQNYGYPNNNSYRNRNDNYSRNDRHYNSPRNERNNFEQNSYRNNGNQYDNNHSQNNRNNSNQNYRNESPHQNNGNRNYFNTNGNSNSENRRFEPLREGNWNNRNFEYNQKQKN